MERNYLIILGLSLIILVFGVVNATNVITNDTSAIGGSLAGNVSGDVIQVGDPSEECRDITSPNTAPDSAIPITSLSPAPYFPTGSDHGLHISTYYTPTGVLYSYLVGKDVTNGGGAGNVFYTIYGDYFSLKSKIFWMESGETLTVWVELCDSLGSYIPAQQVYSNVRVSQAGDTNVGTFIVTEPPNWGFIGTPISGPTPLTVKFNDISAGSWTSWSWDFGDGGSSTLQNPSHTYITPGTYNVHLYAAIPYEKSTSFTRNNYITVTSGGVNLVRGGLFRSNAYDNWIYSNDLSTVSSRNHYGNAGDIPLVGDFNNDGVRDRGVFRSGQWIADNSLDGTVNSRSIFGMTGDIPVVGDFNNDGITDRAVFRNGQWIVDYSMDGSVDSRTSYGMTGDIPLIGDFNNDGVPDRAVFRNGQWIIDYNMDGTVNSRTLYGIRGDIPLVGDFNNDGVMDRAVFRNGEWIIDYNMDGSVNWRPHLGTTGDKPLIWVEI